MCYDIVKFGHRVFKKIIIISLTIDNKILLEPFLIAGVSDLLEDDGGILWLH